MMSRTLAWVLTCVVSTACEPASPASLEREVHFVSHEVQLSGTLVLPSSRKMMAAVVLVHGSGMQLRALNLARRLADHGIATLTYDKRGVGKSGGVFVGQRTISEQNFNLLADDASAALDALRADSRTAGLPLGLLGFSQAGYLVPLAAAKNPQVDFIALWSGPVCKASEEDLYSIYTSDRDVPRPPAFEQVRAWREEPYEWDATLGKDTDPSESLRKLNVPGLWIFGGRDGSVPVDLSIARLHELQRSARASYEYVMFSGLGHDTVEPTVPTVVEWIRRTVVAGEQRRQSKAQAPTESDRYVGTYRSKQPVLELTVMLRDGKLHAAATREPLQMEQVAPDSFKVHDLGNGFAFLDFDLKSQTVTLSQMGMVVRLEKSSNSPALQER
jgi:uncharacterized protein